MPVITRDVNDGRIEEQVVYSDDPRRSAATRYRPTSHEDKATHGSMLGGSMLEMIGGGGAVVLAIIGLTGFMPVYMAAIATIAVGGALLVHGLAVGARWNDMVRATGSSEDTGALGGGLSAEVLGGAAGVTLGILALVGVVPMTLLQVAAIVLGGAILIGAAAQPEIARRAADADRKTYRMVEGASGAMVLAGAGAIVLGILALLNIGPALTLVLVAMLSVGAAGFLNAAALAVRFGHDMRHAHG